MFDIRARLEFAMIQRLCRLVLIPVEGFQISFKVLQDRPTLNALLSQAAAPLFYAVSRVKLIDKAGFIKLLDQFRVNETLDFKIGHCGIAEFH